MCVWKKCYRHIVGFIVSVAIVSCVLVSFGVVELPYGFWAGSEPYFNLQAASLAKGKLALSSDPRALAFDLAWGKGGVQQVWGLGVPTWLLALSFLTGTDPLFFPSRLGFGLAMLLVFWGTISYALKKTCECVAQHGVSDLRFWPVFLPTAAILFCYPSLCALLKSCFRVYEEACAYGYLHAILLCGLLLRVIEKPSLLRFLLLGFASGFAPFIRPTFGFYGLSALVVGTIWGLKKRVSFRKIACGWLLYLCLTGILFWTNVIRFGAATEFGHSLTVSCHPGNLYSLKFGSPYTKVPLAAAAKELVGSLLFDGNFNTGQWFRKDVFRWQSDILRWRENYMPAIGWPMIALAGLGSIVTFALLNWGALREQTLGVATITYGTAAAIGLAAFYLRCPVISSRYLYDFSAALALIAAVSWLIFSAWAVTKGAAGIVGASLIGAFICLHLCHRAGTACSTEVDTVACTRETYEGVLRRVNTFTVGIGPSLPESASVQIDGGKFTGQIGVPFEGFGWSVNDTGQVKVVTTHFVKDMQFLELELTPLNEDHAPLLEPTWIRAKVGLELLERSSIELMESRGFKVRFRSPKNHWYKKGVQLVFIAWVPDQQLAQERAPWRLHLIRWK